MKTKLTPQFIKSAPVGDHPDSVEQGLVFRHRETGAKSFVFRYTLNGVQKRDTLGDALGISLATARELARAKRAEVAGGRDPLGAKQEARAAVEEKKANSLAALAERYFRDAANGRHRAGASRPKSAAGLAEERRTWTKDVEPKFGATPVADIRRRDVQPWLDDLSARAPSAGRHAYTLIRQLMSRAVEDELVDHNPLLGMRVAKPNKREVVPTEHELRQLWKGWKHGLCEPEMALALRTAMVLWQRGDNIVGMRRDGIDRKAMTLTIGAPNMKGRKQHVVPLNSLALSLIDEAIALNPDSPWVFASPRGGARMTRRAFSRAMDRSVKTLGLVRAELDAKGCPLKVTPHDFRRLGRPYLRQHIAPHIVDKVLAHMDTSVGGRFYDAWDYLDEKRQCLDVWATMLIAIVDGDGGGATVLPFKKRA